MSEKARQLVMFDDAAFAPPPVTEPPVRPSPPLMESSAENFRIWLHETLVMLKAAETSPWNPADARFFRVLFDLRSQWLPEEEGQSLRDAFAGHWQRLAIVESRLPPSDADRDS